jgi:hypothetical protein
MVLSTTTKKSSKYDFKKEKTQNTDNTSVRGHL